VSCVIEVYQTKIAAGYTWSDLKGNSKRLHFPVRDEGGLFELTYDTTDQTWELSGLDGI